MLDALNWGEVTKWCKEQWKQTSDNEQNVWAEGLPDVYENSYAD